MKLEDMMKQSKDEFIIDDKKSGEILENILRYRGISINNDSAYEDTCKPFEKKRCENDIETNEIQPSKRSLNGRSVLAVLAGAAVIFLIISAIIYNVTHIRDNANVSAPSVANATDFEATVTEASGNTEAYEQSYNDFFDMSMLSQNNVYNKLSSIARQFSIQDFVDAFGKNQTEFDENWHYYCSMTDENNMQYNINANFNNDCWRKYLYMEFFNETHERSYQYTDEDIADKQKLSQGMTFDEVNKIFDDYVLHGVKLTSWYNSEGEYYQSITVQYIYYLKRTDGYSIMLVDYNIADQTVTRYSTLHEL